MTGWTTDRSFNAAVYLISLVLRCKMTDAANSCLAQLLHAIHLLIRKILATSLFL